LQRPARELIAERLPETVRSVALGLLLAWALGLSAATLPMLLRSKSLDLLASMLAGAILCMPAAVLALLFIVGHAPGRLVVGLMVFPKVFTYTRNLLAQSASRHHVITAWAKGLAQTRILALHILPSIAPQLFSLAGVTITLAFAAAIPVEVICDLPGIGQLAWKAALGRDMELLVDLTLIVTLITLSANAVAELLASALPENQSQEQAI
jgi:peptide/nickel transport system permease protein